MHLPGDIIWEEHDSGSHHVYVYLGNNLKVECSSGHKEGEGVNIGKVHKANSNSTINLKRKIIHLKDFDFQNSTKTYYDPYKEKLIYDGKEIDLNNIDSTTERERKQVSENPQNKTNEKSTTTDEEVTLSTTKAENVMTIEFLNPIANGQNINKNFGDCTIISSDGHVLVQDTLIGSQWSSVEPEMDEKAKTWKDWILYISHGDGDHIGNAINMLEKYGSTCSKVYLPEGGDSSGNIKKIENFAKKLNIPVERLKQGSKFNFGEATVEVLFKSNKGDNDNRHSLVSLITVNTQVGKMGYLTCGDLNKDGESDFFEANIEIPQDVHIFGYKVNHHGLPNTNSEKFMKKITNNGKNKIDIAFENNFCDTEEKFPSTLSSVINLRKKLKKQNLNGEKYPSLNDYSLKQVKTVSKYVNALYSAIYHGTVRVYISNYGFIDVDIEKNVEEEKYEIVDKNTGKVISTYIYEFPKHSKVEGYNPKNELPTKQIEAMKVQLNAGKDVGDMVEQNSNTTVTQQQGPIKILLVGNSFTYYNDLGGIIAELSKKMGKDVIVVGATRPKWGIKQLISKDIAGYYWDNRGEKTKFNGSIHTYDTTFDKIITKDWGDLGREGKWDYVIAQPHHGSASTDEQLYDKVKDMLPGKGNLIILGTTGKNRTKECIEHANKNGYSSIDLKGLIDEQYQGDSNKDLHTENDHPTLREQYITALMECELIFGKEALTNGAVLYNENGKTLDKAITSKFIATGKNTKSNSVTKEDAEQLQNLVTQYFDTYVKNKAITPDTTKQLSSSKDGTKIIELDIDINKLREKKQKEKTTVVSTAGDSLVEPKYDDKPDIMVRTTEQATNYRQYSMVIPKRDVPAIKCDEYGRYDRDNKESYTFQSGKMYPAYYSAFIDEETKELVDYAEINYRVLKDVDENGNVVYGLVNNGDLLKTVRLANTSTNTHITIENGQTIDIPAFKQVMLVGYTAYVNNVLQYGDTYIGTIPISDLIIDNDRWEEVKTKNTREINKYSYNGKKVWGTRRGNKFTLYAVDLVSYDGDKSSSTYDDFIGMEYIEGQDSNSNLQLIEKKENKNIESNKELSRE